MKPFIFASQTEHFHSEKFTHIDHLLYPKAMLYSEVKLFFEDIVLQMLSPIHLFFCRCILLVMVLINTACAENEDVYMDEFIGEDIFRYYQKLAEQHNEEEKEYSLISHDFYENEYIRVFNYTAYNSDNFSNKLGTGEFNSSDLDALSISFGYGIEIKFNKRNKVGYEYLSNFPYDRGQLIRFFWVRLL